MYLKVKSKCINQSVTTIHTDNMLYRFIGTVIEYSTFICVEVLTKANKMYFKFQLLHKQKSSRAEFQF